MKICTDLATWLRDVGYDRIFRMWEYKHTFTPYEQQQASPYESYYIDDHATLVKIHEVIELPDKDVLIGFQMIFDDDDLEQENPSLYYRKLSQIELSFSQIDMKKYDENSI